MTSKPRTNHGRVEVSGRFCYNLNISVDQWEYRTQNPRGLQPHPPFFILVTVDSSDTSTTLRTNVTQMSYIFLPGGVSLVTYRLKKRGLTLWNLYDWLIFSFESIWLANLNRGKWLAQTQNKTHKTETAVTALTQLPRGCFFLWSCLFGLQMRTIPERVVWLVDRNNCDRLVWFLQLQNVEAVAQFWNDFLCSKYRHRSRERVSIFGGSGTLVILHCERKLRWQH